MRSNIAFKIFGIALCLLLLLAAVAVISTFNVSKVNDEVVAIATYYTPISQLMTRVQRHKLQQEIHLERLFRLYGIDPPDRSAIAVEKQRFEELGHTVDEEILTAEGLVEKGLRTPLTEAEKLEFTRLQPLLKAVEREHQQFHDHGLRTLALLDRKQTEKAYALEEILTKEEQDVDRSVDELREELQTFTLKSTLEAAQHERRVLYINLAIAVGATITGLMFASIVTGGLVRPIRRLLNGTQAIEQGKLDTQVPITSSDEIGLLTQSFNHMVGQLRIKERIKETFGKYVDPRIVKNLIEQPDFEASRAERRVVTVFFSDIQGFTSISERLTPAGLVNLINNYFTLMSEPITKNGGIIDKFIGDAIMAFWTPPFVDEKEHARLGCAAALDQFSQLSEFRRALPDLMGLRKDLPDINIRVGIATGEVVVGSIGSEKSKGYTVMGDTVNLGSRLESASKQYGTHVLISEETTRLAGDAIETRELDSIVVLGKSEPVRVFELLARKGELDEAAADLKHEFEQGLAAYRMRDWHRAQAFFQACLRIRPDDGPSKLFVERVAHFRQHPPAENWNGVWSLTEK